MDAIALAWLVEIADGHRPMIMQKSGGLAGFMTYIAFTPGRDVGCSARSTASTSGCSRI